MINIELLFGMNKDENSSVIRFDQTKRAFLKSYKGVIFNDGHIYEILRFLKKLYKVYKTNIPCVILELEGVQFHDKLVYVVLECIIYHYWIEKGIRIVLNIKVKPNIFTEGFIYSPLMCCNNKNDYKSQFEFNIRNKHYRKLIKYTGKNDNTQSVIYGDIKNYMKNNEISQKNVDELSEVLIELIGNCTEHSKTDVLIDIDVTEPTYEKEDNNKDSFYGLNVAIIGFSKILFHYMLKSKMKNSNSNYGKRYDDVIVAFNNHKKYFNDEYTENDFFSIASFQDSISGSLEKDNGAGGRGLTRLLKSIEERADSHYCYLLSGNRVIYLRKEYLNKKNNYVGFNDSGDFINESPNKAIFSRCKTFIPGIAYNLNFVLKENEYE